MALKVGEVPLRSGLVVKGPGKLAQATLTSPAALSPTQVLVKTACVALNPSDAKMVTSGHFSDALGGVDFSGVVVARGKAVQESSRAASLEPGRRVAGLAYGYNEDVAQGTGAFADYVVAEAHLVFALPDGVGLVAGATLPLGVYTAGLALFQQMGLRRDGGDRGAHVLVYGASTASGIYMLQLLKHFGFQPIAICSPHNFALATSAGAVATLDYHSATCAADARALTNDRLAFAADCITTPASMATCYAALGHDKAATTTTTVSTTFATARRYVCLDTIPIAAHSRRDVRPSMVFVLSAYGGAVNWSGAYRCEATPRDRAFAAAWTGEVEALLRAGAVVPMRHQVVGTGLAAVEEGLAKLSGGEVSGCKLVCVVGGAEAS